MGAASDSAAAVAPVGVRAFGPGPRRRALVTAAALTAVLAALGLALALSGGGSHPRRATASLRYGQIPSWLPQQSQPTDRIRSPSPGHPVLAAVEGDTVLARLHSGSAYVTGVGPQARSPARNGAGSESLVPVTFTFTLAQPEGQIPLRARDFSIVTAAGQVVHPAVTLSDDRPLPAGAPAGRALNLTLTTRLPQGEGALRWAPQGPRVLVAWLYSLEQD